MKFSLHMTNAILDDGNALLSSITVNWLKFEEAQGLFFALCMLTKLELLRTVYKVERCEVHS